MCACVQKSLPVALYGPSGCGKTTAIHDVAGEQGLALRTVACHPELGVHDLVGRFELRGGETCWHDGVAVQAAREGAILYLDELEQAPPDVLSVLYALTDVRRSLFVSAIGEEVRAAAGFTVVAAFNPSVRSAALPDALRQRFAFLGFDYLPEEQEAALVQDVTGVDADVARWLVEAAIATRCQARPLGRDGASTRALIRAGTLLQAGLSKQDALEMLVIGPLARTEAERDDLFVLMEAVGVLPSEPPPDTDEDDNVDGLNPDDWDDWDDL